MRSLAFEKKVRVVSSLVEGVSIRATERMCNVSAKTIGRLAVEAGESCWRLHNAMMRDLQIAVLELDEIWAFIQKKQRRVRPEDHPDFGDSYTFLGIAASQKAIVSFVVGKRNVRAALRFLRIRHGGWDALAKAIRGKGATLIYMASRRSPSAGVAVRLARLAGVPVDDLLAGRFPATGTCPHCGAQKDPA